MEWQYNKISEHVFTLVLIGVSLDSLPESTEIAKIREKLSETLEADTRQIMRLMDNNEISVGIPADAPYGPIHKPEAWQGLYTIGGAKLRIPALYAFPNFFGLVCDTEDGTHDSRNVKKWVTDLNKSIAEPVQDEA